MNDTAAHGSQGLLAPPPTIAVIGYGLIGASIALAWRQRTGGVVRTWDASDDARAVAADQLGADSSAATLDAAVANADLIVLAVPTGALETTLGTVHRAARPGAVITDVASVKRAVVDIVRRVDPAGELRFVPAHPIAGSHHSGARHARADLYQGRQVVVTPIAAPQARSAVNTVRSFWEALGAQVCELTPQAHDEVFSAVSHLPHLVAYAYLGSLAGGDADTYVAMAGPGFADFTRIAGANPDLWAEICTTNKDAVLADLARLRHHLADLHDALRRGDGARLSRTFAVARDLRARFEARNRATINPHPSLAASA